MTNVGVYDTCAMRYEPPRYPCYQVAGRDVMFLSLSLSLSDSKASKLYSSRCMLKEQV